MIDLNDYLDRLIAACRAAFGARLLYLGLQGSYMRGEADEASDIDIMLVLDRLSVEDMDAYRGILEALGHRDKACGFICGREELARWNPLEVCQLIHTTRDLLGALTDLLPPATREDEINYVKLSVGNLYHALCHRYIHADRARNVARLRAAGKEMFFLIQNLRYLETGSFAATRRELMASARAEDREMLSLSQLPDGYDFDGAFSAAIAWCQGAFVRIDRARDAAPPPPKRAERP